MFANHSIIISKLLLLYGRLLGLCPYVFDNYTVKLSYLGIIYNLILLLTYSYTFVIVIANRLELHLPRETSLTITMDTLALIFQYFAIISTWLVGICCRSNFQSILTAFVNLRKSAISIGLNLPHASESDLHGAYSRIVFINLLYIFIYLSDHFNLLDYTDFQKQANSWFLFSLPKLVYYNVYLSFLEVVHIFEINYRALNRLLLRSFSRAPRDHDVIAARKIYEIGRLHESFGELLYHVARYFRIILLCTIAATFIHSFLDIYSIYQLITYGKVWQINDYTNFVVNLMWLTTKFLGIYFVCSVPDAMCAQANYMIVILDKLLNDYSQLKNCKEVIKMLMLQLYQKKIYISLYGLFNLDFYLLRNIMSTSIMCLVFMFQLDDLINFDL